MYAVIGQLDNNFLQFLQAGCLSSSFVIGQWQVAKLYDWLASVTACL